MPERLVVVGADAAGMSAASQARRRRAKHDLEIVAFEKSRWVSYSACGEPFHVSGEVESVESLVARTPEAFAEQDIDVSVLHEVTAIDLDRRTVEVLDHRTAERTTTGFDQLMIATGTRAAIPPISGIDLAGVQMLRTLDDAIALRAEADARVGSVVVIGGGYIGLEAAEAFIKQGWKTTVVTSGEAVLNRTIDHDLGEQIVADMERYGINVVTGSRIKFLDGVDGRVTAVGCGDVTLPADLVVLGLGSVPVVEPAATAGIRLGETGAIAVDDHQRTSVEGVWAAGDCAEAKHRVSGRPVNFHLGTVANKTGRVAGMNIGGEDVSFPGVLGTIVTRVGPTEISGTGLRLADAEAAGFEAVEATADGTTIAGYMSEAAPMRIRVVAERGSGRILGAQVVGGQGAGKRIDVFATAIWNEMTAGDLAWTDLAYAPPFSGVWDLIHIASRAAAAAAGQA